MNTGSRSHISEDTMERYALGRIPDLAGAPLEEHLLICLTCQMRLEETKEFIKVMKAATAAVACEVVKT